MDKEKKKFTPKAINLCGKRRMLSSIKGWEIVHYNNYSKGYSQCPACGQVENNTFRARSH